jgi:signal transduction protein with GAF and PtsI domain
VRDPASRHPLLNDLEGLLNREGPLDVRLLTVLDRLLAHFGCAVGTIHRLDPGSGLLQLQAQRGLPDMLRPRVDRIPLGKGMAGLAAERRQPVQVCNLQTDTSGVAKPAAKETRMEGSIALPILDGDALRGVLGVAKPTAYEFTAAETALLQEGANIVGKFLGA